MVLQIGGEETPVEVVYTCYGGVEGFDGQLELGFLLVFLVSSVDGVKVSIVLLPGGV
jgi:hypothetical protein